MNLVFFKLFSAVAIFLAALLPGILPIRSNSVEQRFFVLGDAFASGIFLGAGAFHMLPEAIRHYQMNASSHPVLNSMVLCILGIALFTVLERIALRINKNNHSDHSPVTAYLLVTILSIHSLVEGAALGINSLFSDALMIFIAIIAHKGSASFALAITLRRSPFTRLHMFLLILLFALMTPFGIITATILAKLFQNQQGQLLEASFNAFAAGTFLYIGSIRILHSHFRGISQSRSEIIALLLGITVMIFVGAIL